jgi:Carboxypeptidase regulatory-like domain
MNDAFVAAFLTVLATASTGAAVNPGATVIGTVTLTAADGRTFSGEGARVMLACPADGTTRTEVSDEHGAFRFLNVPVDRCSIEADVQGFVGQTVSVVTVADQVVATDLHLGIAPLRAGVNVKGTAPFPGPKRLRRSCRCARS